MCSMKRIMSWGERTRKRFKLGQPIRVQVVAVDRYLKTIDFLPVREF